MKEVNTVTDDETNGIELSGVKNGDDGGSLEEEREKVVLITVDGPNETENTEGSNRCYNVYLCIFVLLDLILVTGIIVVGCLMYFERKLDPSSDIALCLRCKDLQIHPDDVIEGMLLKGETNDICCMKDRENSDNLMSYFVDHWLKEKLAKDDRRFTRYQCRDQSISGTQKPYIIIKLVGRNVKQTEKHDKILWDGRSDAAILSDNKDFDHHKEHGVIEIKEAGLYQIYTQVVLNHDKIWHRKHHKANVYQHSVIRLADKRSVIHDQYDVIMKASNNFCSCKTEKQVVTSYLGGAFYLSEGDRLAVKVNNITEIVPVAHMNFFGMYMV